MKGGARARTKARELREIAGGLRTLVAMVNGG
jgi:hypothetical protein